MSPVKIALVAALFVAFAVGHADVAPKEEVDSKVPELAEQQHSDDEMAQASPTSDDEMDQLPEGVTEEQFAQATDEQKAKWGSSWGFLRRRFSVAKLLARRRSSSLAQKETSDDEMDQLPEGVTEEQLAQATDEQKAKWGSLRRRRSFRRRALRRRRSFRRRRRSFRRRRRSFRRRRRSFRRRRRSFRRRRRSFRRRRRSFRRRRRSFRRRRSSFRRRRRSFRRRRRSFRRRRRLWGYRRRSSSLAQNQEEDKFGFIYRRRRAVLGRRRSLSRRRGHW